VLDRIFVTVRSPDIRQHRESDVYEGDAGADGGGSGGCSDASSRPPAS
jgi:hypothetical protein